MLIPGTGIGQPRWSSGLVLVCVDLGPSLHDAFLGSGIKTPQAKITTPADRTLRYDFMTVNAHRTLLSIIFFLAVRHYRCFSRARQSGYADVERKVCSQSFCYKLPDQGTARAGYFEQVEELAFSGQAGSPQCCHPHREEGFGEQELSDTAASFVSDDTGRHFRIRPVSLAHQPELEVDSLPPFLFNYRWRNTEGGVSVYVGGRANTQQQRASGYGGPAYSTFTPEKGGPRPVCPGCGMWGSMLNELTNHSQPRGISHYAAGGAPSDIIRCLPARLVLMRRNLTYYCTSAEY